MPIRVRAVSGTWPRRSASATTYRAVLSNHAIAGPLRGSCWRRCSYARANVSPSRSNSTSGCRVRRPRYAVTAPTWRS